MKRKVAAAVLLAALFVSIPPVFEAVYQHVFGQLAGRESNAMINAVSVVYTALIYLPVLAIVTLVLCVLFRSKRHGTSPPHTRERSSRGVSSSSSAPSNGFLDMARDLADAHLMVDDPDLYLGMELREHLARRRRERRR